MLASGLRNEGLTTEHLAHSLRSDEVNHYRESPAQQSPWSTVRSRPVSARNIDAFFALAEADVS